MGLDSDNQGMELAASSKPLKPSANISEIVSKFAKVCKFRSIGVFHTSETVDHGHVYPVIAGDNSHLMDGEHSEDVRFCAKKISPEVKNHGDLCARVELVQLFDTLLALDTLGKIKKAYEEEQLKEANAFSAGSARFLAEVKVMEQQLEKLKSQAKSKGKKVASLRKKLLELETKNTKLAEEIEEREREMFAGLNHHTLESLVRAVGKAIHDFAKPLIALMKHSDWDLDQAAYAIQSSVVYVKRSHKKYAFEAYITRRMFRGFLQQPCFLGNIMKLDDPIVALTDDPQSSFAEFCRDKYMLVVHPRMEESFFGNLDHRNLVANGIHPCTPFYRAFIRMARCVWYLQALIGYIEPKAEIFGVKPGAEFVDVYMEVVDELKVYEVMDNERYKVEFMVMPGFMLKKSLIRSQVYVSRGEFSNGWR
ncbi:protein GRAVITROPIC IN THE LIGHT 1-like isoform X2 [Salvia splendens]|uniref:protein GRAVITROPIC IN THE LIGHT 1-like isoform X2 n=1 Tax=Salvia splendens TaxID=180675 RepID=UPI001C2590A1|nr:protein GRAVITROPIC IN THE LIGHT 1-like isoform X2 [Salvia splendens]